MTEQRDVKRGSRTSRILRIAALGTVFIAATLVCKQLELESAWWFQHLREPFLPMVWRILGLFNLVVFSCFCVSRFLWLGAPRSKHMEGRASRIVLIRRVLIGLFAVAYFATWVFGAPAVVSALVNSTVAEYRGAGRDAPEIGITHALPLAPGLVSVRFTYDTSGAGWAEQVICLWWPRGQREIWRSRDLLWIF